VLKTKARLEESLESSALATERIHHISAGLDERSLEHVRKKGKDAVQRLELLVLTNATVGDTSEQLGKDGEIEDKRGSQKRILALVEDVESVAATHHDLGVVFIDSALAVTDGRDILDDDKMVGMLALLLAMGLVSWLEQEMVRLNHIINDAALRDLLAPELSLARQVAPIVVTEMVVRSDRERLDTSVHEELGEHALHLGLPALEIVTPNEGTVLLSERNAARNEGVLGGAIDEGGTLEDSSDCKQSGRRDF